MTRLAPLLLISLLPACAARPPSDWGPAPDARTSVSEHLYFGRDVGGGGTVSHEEWAAFVREVAAPRLPGMTIWGAAGAWRDPASGAVVSESTFVVEVVHRGDRPTLASLDEVAREYMRRFRQRAVLRTTHAVRERSYAQELPPSPPPQPRPATTPGPRVEFLTPPGDWPYPFSPAVRVGDLIFVSGQIGSRTEGGRVVLVPGGIEAETRQTLDNVREILERAGSSLDRVVKCTVMMADMAEWPRMNTIYATYFPGPKPARSALGANGLALGARVEIECIAAAGRG